jgi:hypothetical protein
MKRTLLIGCMILVLMMPVVASAALFEGSSFSNLYNADRIELSLTQGNWFTDNITIDTVLFGGDAFGWSITSGASTEPLVLEGSTPLAAGSGLFELSFNDNQSNFISSLFGSNWLYDFTLHWTEYSGATALGQIDYTFDNGVLVTPLPASAWMLLSGLAMFIGIRRRNVG